MLIGLQFLEDDFTLKVGNYRVFITRFLCAILLHCQLLPEVRQGLMCMKYLTNHPKKFKSLVRPFLVTLMQLITSVLTEVINLVLICGQSDSMDVVINFVALGAITQIDNFYAGSL